MTIRLAGWAAAPIGILAMALAGCGGQSTFGGIQSSLGGDIAPSFGTPLSSQGRSGNNPASAGVIVGTYPMIETSFQLPTIPGDPFDYEKVNVQVQLKKPDSTTIDVPAFFDGGTTWRMRFTPNVPGTYTVVSIKLNKEITHEEGLEKKQWTVKGDPEPGFVRIDKGDKTRFVFDDGGRYFPIGHNQAWHNPANPDTPDLFAKMHASGENWSRVWMTYWDGKNLMWPESGKPEKLGDIDLGAAKKWDAIVSSAAKNDIYFQLVVEHHGEYASKSGFKYSSGVNPNWESNPFNEANGGFLKSPEEFFTNSEARGLIKRKLYYMLSRWGYSPNILAFELFNEVENTDAAHGKLWDNIALWHHEMALFLKQYDGYRHLITTSSATSVPLDSGIWDTVDYVQTHTYPPDLITALGTPLPQTMRKLDKPIFVGEFGPGGSEPTRTALHNGLWASIMRSDAGAGQFWDWDAIDKENLYSEFQPATSFVFMSNLASHGGTAAQTIAIDSSSKADLTFAPGGGWATTKTTEFVVGSSGVPAGISQYPTFFQGQAHHEMTPGPLTFQVSYAAPGEFSVSVGQVSKGGAHLVLAVDGKKADKEFSEGQSDYSPKSGEDTVKIMVPEGSHSVTLENTGRDWFTIKSIRLANYASALSGYGRVSKDFLAAWIYHRGNVTMSEEKANEAGAAVGQLKVTGLQGGKYRATWWNTHDGKAIQSQDLTIPSTGEAPALTTPPVSRDVALYIVKAGTKPPAEKSHKSRHSATASSGIGSGATGATPAAPTVAVAPGGSPAPAAPSTSTPPDSTDTQ